MNHLTRNDYATALRLLAALEQQAGDREALLAALLGAVASYVACESVQAAVLEASACDAARPFTLVASADDAGATLAVPLAPMGSGLLCVVLRRHRTTFSPRDGERLALLQPHLAFLCRQAGLFEAGAQGPAGGGSRLHVMPPSLQPLTPREAEVMRWLSFGKTDADIAAVLAISKRTVHKHLEHIYEKLGVETRTAAVMAAGRGKTAPVSAGRP